MSANFDFAFHYMLENEGGYSNIPEDHGGPTNWGITHDDLLRWRRNPTSANDVRNLQQAEAEAIYKAWYWDTLNLDKLDEKSYKGIVTAIFDIGVVRGIGRSARYAQQVCNQYGSVQLRVDGQLGPKSLQAIATTDKDFFIDEFSARAKRGFEAIVEYNPSQAIFLKGWTRRATRLLTLKHV
jgi:lysozyme family protein